MLKRLRLKFVLVNMTIVTVMLCIIFGVVFYTTRQNLEEESLRMMHMVAGNPAMPGRPGEVPEEIRLPFFILDVGPNGEVVATGGGYYDLSDKAFLENLVHIVFAAERRADVIDAYKLRYIRTERGRGERLIFADISSEQNTLENLVRTGLLIGVSSFLVFLLISICLARWAVKPVEKAWAQQRQFVADASHELKTPLTVITTNAELLHDAECNEETRLRFSDNILTMSRQMRGLTENLLELARADNGMAKTVVSLLDFSRLVGDAILPFEPICFEKGLALTVRIEDGISLKGSETQLRQVVEILMDNAQKYALEHTGVSVTLRKQGRHCLLTVANPGKAISREDLKNIFKRFYRVDQARTRDGSYGLGLPIAESIVTGHRGRIWAESTGGVNSFFVQLPL